MKNRSIIRALFLRKRAGKTPLHLHVYQIKSIGGYNDIIINRFLLHSANRTRSLDISLNTPLHELLLVSLTCIGIGCTSGSLKCWTLRNKDILRPLVVDTRPWSPQDEASLNYIEDPCLPPLTALNLKGAFIEWNSVAYRGLLELRIEHLSGTMCPTIAQLAMVLEASPRLRILRLADITIRDGEPHPTLVRLEDLQELDLGKISTADLCALLDIIRPGRKDLNVSMRLNDRPPTIQVFFNALTSLDCSSMATLVDTIFLTCFVFPPTCISWY
ncbi:hypothetical protein FRC12_015687 [Ceratobasidium sp. 428]|nr:hypothetical protein FRC12_015687 [Ceratobasidium sp. 428]